MSSMPDDARICRTQSSSRLHEHRADVCSSRTPSGSSSRKRNRRRAARSYARSGGSANCTLWRESCRTCRTRGRHVSYFLLASSESTARTLVLWMVRRSLESAPSCANCFSVENDSPRQNCSIGNLPNHSVSIFPQDRHRKSTIKISHWISSVEHPRHQLCTLSPISRAHRSTLDPSI